MNKRLKKVLSEWIRALRSGKYKQGKYQMRNKHNECCCFGVAADRWKPEAWLDRCWVWEFYGESGFPPHKLIRHLGMTKDNARYLAHLNDGGWTFPEIADLLEKCLETGSYDIIHEEKL